MSEVFHAPQALSYAKEAYRLRTKIFQEKFTYSVEQQAESHCLRDMQIRRSVAREFWSFSGISWQLESCYLSPWNVLQCYLESILQVWILYPYKIILFRISYKYPSWLTETEKVPIGLINNNISFLVVIYQRFAKKSKKNQGIQEKIL